MNSTNSTNSTDTTTSTNSTSSTEGPPQVMITLLMPTTTVIPEAIPNIVMTIAFIAGAVLMGILISKIADLIYDKYVTRRGKNHVHSEQTKKLLKARAAIMRMKPDPKTKEGRLAKRAASTWLSRAAGKQAGPQIVVDINRDTQEIGGTHVPGIPVTAEPSTPEHSPILRPKTPSKGGNSDSAAAETAKPTNPEPHPMEKINIKIKPGGPLPPVVVNDVPKH